MEENEAEITKSLSQGHSAIDENPDISDSDQRDCFNHICNGNYSWGNIPILCLVQSFFLLDTNQVQPYATPLLWSKVLVPAQGEDEIYMCPQLPLPLIPGYPWGMFLVLYQGLLWSLFLSGLVPFFPGISWTSEFMIWQCHTSPPFSIYACFSYFYSLLMVISMEIWKEVRVAYKCSHPIWKSILSSTKAKHFSCL